MIFLNDRLVSAEEARIDPADRGLLLGDGLFETLLCRSGRIERLEAHLARLRAGAAVLGILPPDLDLAEAAATLLEANELTARDAALRITLTRGLGPRGLLPPDEARPTLLISAVAQPAAQERALSAVVATIRRNEQSPLSRLKTLNYLDNVLAKREAVARGADEAILLNTVGRLASATAANLFLVRGRSLFTPPPSEGVLPGITRAAILELAPALGLAPVEAPLEPGQLRDADEAFVSNSLIGVRALASLDGQSIGDGASGPTVRRLSPALLEQAP
ncbi:MAG: aminotransferase class IV [Kiloniellales bacterium]